MQCANSVCMLTLSKKYSCAAVAYYGAAMYKLVVLVAR